MSVAYAASPCAARLQQQRPAGSAARAGANAARPGVCCPRALTARAAVSVSGRSLALGTTRRCNAAAVRIVTSANLRNIDWPQAILFDCDGVLCDTERDGHRITFNAAFKEKGLKCEWDADEYGELVKIGGGKERMTKYFLDHEDKPPFSEITGKEERAAFVQELHLLKTKLFVELIDSGALPLRPGVKRLILEALENGVKIAVCSTSNERSVSGIVQTMLGPQVARVMRVFAGDVVPKKKPAPDIYLLAAKELNLDPARCVVIEDSRIGMLAGKAAGMRVVVTTSPYTQEEDFAEADAVFDCIGDRGDERFFVTDLTTPGSFWLNPPRPGIAYEE